MKLPLHIYNPRPECCQVVLKFGPHSFTLYESKKQKAAEDALRVVQENWKLYRKGMRREKS